ncbi:peptidase T [Bdellovibrio bacteriovorus]|uniref:peptidase T n=1 Tax=Bdellovibrio bacteriovorus TaxID=959 RepID=UPI0035A59FB2
MKQIEKQLVDRFFRYLAVSSQSDDNALALPSTSGQQKLAELLAQELKDLGLQNIVVDQKATVTAVKPGTKKGGPRIGFITHIDTVDVGLSPHIHPQILKFTGEDVCLNKKENIYLKVSEHPEIKPYQGQDIIFSDGTSVLGADNKAAVSVVMTLLANLREDQQYGDIVVAFVPDEEIGLLGAKAMDLSRFDVDFAYTIDCCELGEVVYENFNAATADMTFTGVTAHPMSAKGVLVNPILMAQDFMALFDRAETPENTAGREGYIWFNGMTATQQEAKLTASIRDFDLNSFAKRKEKLQKATESIQAKYPTARVQLKITDTYSNISSAIGEDRRAIDLIFAGLKEIGVEPKVIPMRGGTDGAALSAKGILTPNFFTGALNFHSKYEFLPIPSFVKSYELAEKICLLAAR